MLFVLNLLAMDLRFYFVAILRSACTNTPILRVGLMYGFDIFHVFHMYDSSYSFLKHSYHISVSYDPKRPLEGKVLWENNYTQNTHL
jgi:hypothetical protein